VQIRTRAGLSLPTRISLQNGALNVRQKIGVSVGARMTLTFNERFAVITGITYVPGYAILRGAGKQIDIGTSSHLLTAATGARYWLLPEGRSLSWQVQTGLGAVAGGQRSYGALFESSTVSGTIGTTVRYQIGRIVRLQLRVQERLFRIRFRGPAPPSSKSPLQVSFGLSFPILEFASSTSFPAVRRFGERSAPTMPSTKGAGPNLDP
jgi:hypothetical protein